MTLPRADRDRTTTQQSPRVAVRTSFAGCAGWAGVAGCVDVPTVAAEVAAAAGAETVVDVSERCTP